MSRLQRWHEATKENKIAKAISYEYSPTGRITKLIAKYLWQKETNRLGLQDPKQQQTLMELTGIYNINYQFPFTTSFVKRKDYRSLDNQNYHFEVTQEVEPAEGKVFCFKTMPGEVYFDGNLMQITKEEAIELLQNINSFSI